MSVEKGFGANEAERRFRIFGNEGKAGNAFANAEVAGASWLMSAFGDMM